MAVAVPEVSVEMKFGVVLAFLGYSLVLDVLQGKADALAAQQQNDEPGVQICANQLSNLRAQRGTGCCGAAKFCSA
eukprot:CAMPEP_0202915876 /NCGR_PEP_ID=MMETSP1392-20130828/66937_1 /ASSEMBLY_ACC=CAM_ASM_000868 /TAXON_ID=225041 /ORGANISM="Chlamydomonas chlamydogama, Strain SAG 11-48b" /LENGTH=75 /DNA_ID=CAMNT_0049608075 /DNA_START=17 /DNA_END=245 /DNA_ORIENTATION=-